MYDVIIVDFPQIADLQWSIGQNWVFRQKKVLKIGISLVFFLQEKKMTFLSYRPTVRFKTILRRYFSK